jgi:hypothetical protein
LCTSEQQERVRVRLDLGKEMSAAQELEDGVAEVLEPLAVLGGAVLDCAGDG